MLGRLLCGACRWCLGSVRGRHGRRDCVWKLAGALLAQLTASRVVVWRGRERGRQSGDEVGCNVRELAARGCRSANCAWTSDTPASPPEAVGTCQQRPTARDDIVVRSRHCNSNIHPRRASIVFAVGSTVPHHKHSRANTAGTATTPAATAHLQGP